MLALCMSDQEPDTLVTASELGGELRDYVMKDREEALTARRSRAVARASMGRILDSL